MLTWPAEHLRPYQVETSFDLENWMDLGSTQIGSSAIPSQGVLVGYAPPRLFFRVREGAVRPGFDSESLSSSDDSGSEQVIIGFPINFGGALRSNLWVNNNGNVTFTNPHSAYTPVPLTLVNFPIIAPFWGDVDTRAAPIGRPNPWTVKYGLGQINGANAFGVTWEDVGYYLAKTDKLNSFQILIIDRSFGASPGDFDLEFNYNKIEWDEGDFSNSLDDGFGNGSAARAFVKDNASTSMQVRGSGVNLSFLDNVINPTTRLDTGIKNYTSGLIYRSHNNSVPGRFVFRFRNGTPLDDRVVIDAGPDPTAMINPSRTFFTLRGTATPPPGSTTTYLWTVTQGAATISSPTQLTTNISLPSFQSATFKLSAICESDEMTIYAEDTVVLDRIAP